MSEKEPIQVCNTVMLPREEFDLLNAVAKAAAEYDVCDIGGYDAILAAGKKLHEATVALKEYREIEPIEVKKNVGHIGKVESKV